MSQEKVILRAAMIQMVSTISVEENLLRASVLIEQAASSGAELVVLPENFAAFGNKNLRAIGEQESSPQGKIRQFLSDLAQRYNIWLVGGTLPTVEPHPLTLQSVDDDRVFAACIVYNPVGEEVGRYDKIHLFDADVRDSQRRYRESASFQPGSRTTIVQTPWGKLGMAVCYDIRFAELFLSLVDQGVDLIAIPSAFTFITGQAHWQVLLRARAVETMCYVMGACQGGEHSFQRKTWGGSAIVTPWGDILKEKLHGEGVVITDCNLLDIQRVRQQIPVHQHRQKINGIN